MVKDLPRELLSEPGSTVSGVHGQGTQKPAGFPDFEADNADQFWPVACNQEVLKVVGNVRPGKVAGFEEIGNLGRLVRDGRLNGDGGVDQGFSPTTVILVISGSFIGRSVCTVPPVEVSSNSRARITFFSLRILTFRNPVF